ncbi:MAG: Gfo/Idh/MocA family oxidoreductase [Kiritimatiellae bacterium]|nr:Gfo/Idh/MocA family oxidoreductase [Kiritimatiellia bacterium]
MAERKVYPKVRIAAIGTGGRGHTDLHSFLRSGLCEIVCAADVYAPALEWVKREQPNAKIYTDFKVMLRECAGQYDAVSIMTPDHTHCTAFLEASKYNVPVYCAKPLAHTISETLTMMRIAREKNLITHVSHHGNSEPGTPLLREWLEAGILGQALEAHVFVSGRSRYYTANPDNINHPKAMPDTLDWELWQGPIKRHSYFETLVPRGDWRSWMMYGEGCVGDWCAHLMGPFMVDLDLDLPIAVTLDDPSWDPKKAPYSFPQHAHYIFEFAAKGKRGPFKIHWYDVLRDPPRPPALEKTARFNPVKDGWAGGWLKTEKETLMFGMTGLASLRVVPHERMKEFKKNLPPKKYPRIRDHWAEFLEAVQEKRPTNTPFELGGKVTLMGLMGTIATRFPNRRLTFDEKTMQFTNCPEANAFFYPDWTRDAREEYGPAIGLTEARAVAAAAAVTPEPKAKVAAMLYSISKYIRTNGLERTLVELHDIGYKGVEFQTHFGLKPAEIKRMLDNAGLVAVGSHVDCADFLPDRIKAACEFHLGYGNNLLICAGAGNFPKKGEDLDAFMKRLVERYSKAAEIAALYGCKIGLHNHRTDFDLKLKDGTTYWDYFFTHVSPLVCMEQDVGWTACTGNDPCEQWRKYPGRSITFHAKEDNGWKAGIGGRDIKTFDGILGQPAQPGARGVNWDQVAVAADADHIPWWVVECEKHFDTLDIVRQSFDFLKAKGRC